jgi:hypothetical protein
VKSLWLRTASFALCLLIVTNGSILSETVQALEAESAPNRLMVSGDSAEVPSDSAMPTDSVMPIDSTVPSDTIVTDGLETEAVGQAGSELFITYLYASQRIEPWMAYTKSIAKASKDAEVLNKFGLVTAESVQALSDRRLAAQEELKRLTLLKATAYEELISGYNWTTGVSGKLEAQAAAMAAAANPQAIMQLQQAQQNEKKASTEVVSATLQVKSGTLDTITALAKQEAYLQARLSAIDVKAAYSLSIVSAYTAASGSIMRVSAFLEAIDHHADSSIKNEWMRVISEFAVLVTQSASSLVGDSGEVYVPLRPYAESLHYQIEWDPIESQVTITKGNDRISMVINQNLAVRNDQVLLLHSTPYIHNESTYVPVLFFSSVLGVEVYWSESNGQTIIIPQLIGEEG